MSRQKSVDTARTIMLCLVVAVVSTSHIEASGTWSPTGSMSTARGFHTATLLPDGRVLVAGGYSDFRPTAESELYDPRLGTWSPTAAMSTGRVDHTATLLSDGRVLISGAGSAEIYNPALGTWSQTGSMTVEREQHTATLLQDGRVLVSGGGSYTSNTLASAEIYDPALGTWSQTGSMTVERELHAATVLLDGKVLVSGGSAEIYSDDGEGGIHYGNAQWASAEIYDPVSGSWSETGSMRAWRLGLIRIG